MGRRSKNRNRKRRSQSAPVDVPQPVGSPAPKTTPEKNIAPQVILLQALWRARMAQQHVAQKRGAVLLQSVWRSHAAKQRVEVLRKSARQLQEAQADQQQVELRRKYQCAVSVQRVWRSHAAKQRVEVLRKSARQLQARLNEIAQEIVSIREKHAAVQSRMTEFTGLVKTTKQEDLTPEQQELRQWYYEIGVPRAAVLKERLKALNNERATLDPDKGWSDFCHDYVPQTKLSSWGRHFSVFCQVVTRTAGAVAGAVVGQ